tara:strand:+ start:184 stop:456 length:273 start_codon:yes stop_codon:yes gene_type:complete
MCQIYCSKKKQLKCCYYLDITIREAFYVIGEFIFTTRILQTNQQHRHYQTMLFIDPSNMIGENHHLPALRQTAVMCEIPTYLLYRSTGIF